MTYTKTEDYFDIDKRSCKLCGQIVLEGIIAYDIHLMRHMKEDEMKVHWTYYDLLNEINEEKKE